MVFPILKAPSIFFAYPVLLYCAIHSCLENLHGWSLHSFSGHSASPCLRACVSSHFCLASSLNSLFQHCLSSPRSAPQSTAWLCCCDGLLSDTGRLLLSPQRQKSIASPAWMSPAPSASPHRAGSPLPLIMYSYSETFFSAFNRKGRVRK